jgi:hypothetical protein
MSECNRPAPSSPQPGGDAIAQMTTCPDCGLVLHVTNDALGSNFVYDMRDWRRICTRVHLGDAALCLIQRRGTQSLPTAMAGGERGDGACVDC